MRNLKILGTALVAMFAISAAFSAMASADTLTSESSPITATASQETVNSFIYPGIGATECEKVAFSATAKPPTTSVAEVKPTYTGCETAGLASTVTTTGCTYTLNIGAATTGTANVVCTGANKIKVTVLQGATSKCTIEVGSQSALGTITYTNIGAGTTRELTASLNLSGIAANAVAGTGVGPCTTGSTTSATLTGTVKITGETDGGTTHVGIFLS